MALSASAVNNWLGSKGGQTAVGAVGSALAAYGGSRESANNRQLQLQQLRLEALQRMLSDSQARTTRANELGYTGTTLGDEEAYRTRMQILGTMLKGARNFQITPGDPAVAAAMPKMSGGFLLPDGGLPSEVFANFTPEAIEGAIQRRRDQLAAAQTTTPTDEQARTQAAIDQMLADAAPQPQKKKGGGFWGKVGGVIKIAAPIAAAVMSGGTLTPLAAAALAGGGVAAGSKLQGNSWKSSLAQGAIGAASAGAGAGAAGAVGRSAASRAATTAAGISASQAAEYMRRQQFGG